MRPFALSFIVTFLALALAFYWAGWDGLFSCLLVTTMGVTFSFDNAVVNATVLKDMDQVWRQRFLTWGILIAVFGMYYLFPLLIVSTATGLGLIDVMKQAIDDPASYSEHLHEAHMEIAAFGGMFLLLVFLKFIFNEQKRHHWLGKFEAQLAKLGNLEAVEVVIALLLLLGIQSLLPVEERLPLLTSGVFGVVLFVAVNSITALCSLEGDHAKASGMMGFLYLNLLDASFSLDAVVGSFAISGDIILIVLGLTAGAMFVRSLTVYLVNKGTLEQYVYLEHGAHYAIGALAVIMLVTISHPVPEAVTGLIGLVLIGASFLSSVHYNRNHRS